MLYFATLVVRASFAVLFVVAAGSKLLDNPPLATSLRGLGLSNRYAQAAARLVVGFELLLIAALVGVFGRWIGGLTLALAAIGFIVVGVRAMTLKQSIPCSCFSVQSRGKLGSKQVAIGVAVGLLGMSVATQWSATSTSGGVVIGALVLLSACCIQIVRGFVAFREGAGYRLATRRA